MEPQAMPASLQRIEYARTFQFLRLFHCFRMAIAPSRLMVAMLLIIVAYLGGCVMDLMGAAFGPAIVDQRIDGVVAHREWDRYRTDSAESFKAWYNNIKPSVRDGQKRGVFEELLDIQTDLFQKLIRASINFRLGFDQFSPDAVVNDQTVIGVLRLILITLPGWLWHAHKLFAVVYTVYLGLLWALLGGAISRQMVVAAAVDRIMPAGEAVAFSLRRIPTYIAAPLLPLGFVLVIALVLAIGGLAFYVPGLNLLAALLFAAALAVSFVMALLLILWFAGVHMIYPAIGAQGSDALDAMARSFSYVMSRPWQLFFYTFVALVYGAATYIFVGLFVYLMIASTHWAVGAWVGDFNTIFPQPDFGRLPRMPPQLEGTAWAASKLIHIWVYLLMGVLGAYAINFYLAAFSQVYLMLRQSTDGDDPSEVFQPHPTAQSAAQDKVEPVNAVDAD